MKVICIDAVGANNFLQEGDKYTPYRPGFFDDIMFNVPVIYVRETDTDGLHRPWCADRFIPCSDIDETETIRESLTQTA